MNIIKNIAVVLLAFLVFTGCDDEDFTGNSSLTPTTGATISVSGLPSSAPSFLEMDTTFTFTVTLSEAQVVDVPVYISQSAGDATLGADFTIDNNNSRVVIPAYSTSGTVTISVLGDTEPEGTETFTIQIGDERTDNATITPVEVTFTIGNVVSEDLSMNLAWATAAVFDASGAELGATDVGDLIFNLVAADTLYSQADGASFESLDLSGSAPNGTYSVYASIYAAADLGDLGDLPLANLIFDYAQLGIQSGSFTFDGALDLANVCDANRYHMADVVKSGTSYTITPVGMLPALLPTALVGTYTGQDSNLDGIGFVGQSQIVAVLNTAGDDIEMTGINVNFMQNVWGEAIQTSVPVKLTIDYAAKTIVIEEQFIFTTLFGGSLFDYTIYGTGYVDACNNVILEYEMNQDGFLVGDWLNANGYSSDALFTAIISL